MRTPSRTQKEFKLTQQAYLTKEQAARFLSVSPRRVLELATEGKIRKQESYNPATHRRQTVLCEEDIRRLAEARQQLASVPQEAASNPSPASASSRNLTLQKGLLAPGKVRPLPAELSHAPSHAYSAPILERVLPMWLTLDEAACYSGLPARVLHRLIVSGKLPAIDCGVRKGGRFRVRKADLDLLEGERLEETGVVRG